MSDPNRPKVISLGHMDQNARAFFGDNGDPAIRADLAMSAARMGSWYHYIQDNQVWGDAVALDLLGFEGSAQPWTMQDFVDVVHPDDRERVGLAVQSAYDGQTPFYDVTFRVISRQQDIAPQMLRWVSARGQVIARDAENNPVKLYGVVWDVTASKIAEQRMSLLASEMDHRVKNAFAVIRALINIGADTSSDKSNFANTLRGQVEAMATAHTLSAQIARSQKDATASVALSEILETALSPWIEIGTTSQTTVTITCDPEISMPPAKVSAFAMMIYELSTNATKYGPLGEIGGSVDVTVLRTDKGGLTMFWQETVPTKLDPETFTANAPGFGQVLLDHCAHTLGAQVTRNITPYGLQLHLDIPLMVAG